MGWESISYRALRKNNEPIKADSGSGFWKEKETMFPVLSRMAIDLISVQASSVASESAFSTSGRVLSIRSTRLTPASLEMCMCLKDHLDAKERKQDKCPLEIPLDFKEDVFDDELRIIWRFTSTLPQDFRILCCTCASMAQLKLPSTQQHEPVQATPASSTLNDEGSNEVAFLFEFELREDSEKVTRKSDMAILNLEDGSDVACVDEKEGELELLERRGGCARIANIYLELCFLRQKTKGIEFIEGQPGIESVDLTGFLMHGQCLQMECGKRDWVIKTNGDVTGSNLEQKITKARQCYSRKKDD
nr:putative AC transposase [Tanacetum cinerariifolium]